MKITLRSSLVMSLLSLFWITYSHALPPVAKSLAFDFVIDTIPPVVSFEKYKGESGSGYSVGFASDGKRPLVIINGVKKGRFGSKELEAIFSAIDSSEVELYSIMSKEKGMVEFGADAADGVIVLISKQSALYKFEDFTNRLAENTNSTVKTLFVLNGTLLVRHDEDSDEDMMNKIDINLIKSITVLKGEQAVKKYGKKGENGVVEIYTK